MFSLYLTPTALSSLTLFIFAALVSLHLTYVLWKRRRKRPVQTLYLALVIALLSLYALSDFFVHIFIQLLWILPLQTILMGLVVLFWVQFAYQMPALFPERRRESRVLLGLTLLFLAGDVVFVGHRYTLLAEGSSAVPINPVAILSRAGMLLWTLLVFIRQMNRADSRALPLWRKWQQPADRHSRAARDFALVNLIPMGLAVLLVVYDRSLLISPTALFISISLGLLLTLLLIVLSYLNYLPEHTSFLFRLLAISLAFILGILSVVGHAVAPAFIQTYHETHLLTLPQTLQFSPNAHGGYDIRALADPVELLEAEVTSGPDQASSSVGGLAKFGERLDFDRASATFPLTFDFPFYDQRWSEADIMREGRITFGASAQENMLFDYGLPSIYLVGSETYFTEQMSQVYADVAPHHTTITWLTVQEVDGGTESSTAQLRLYPDGVFEMVFEAMPMVRAFDVFYHWHGNRLLGAAPGAPATPQTLRFRTDLPMSSGPDGAIETYNLDFRAALSHFLAPLFWLIIFGTLATLIGLPLALRMSLAKPLNNLLDGVQEINQGHLDVRVPITYDDEIGYLTQAFNAMAADLEALVRDLETRVADRTAELAATSAYMDSILRSATDYAIVAVDEQLRITYINPLAERLFKLSAADVLGQAIPGLPGVTVSPERFQAGLQEAKTHGIYRYAYTQETPSGPRHIAARLARVVGANGDVIGYAHFSRDISARVETEAQLLRQQRALSALEERERIGRELHDGVGQVMGYLNLQMQAVSSLLADDRQTAATKVLQQLIGVTQTAHNNVREFILGMHQSELASTDFWGALQKMAQTFEDERGLPVNLSLPADQPEWLVPPNDLHLLLIIQEALTNAYKHAQATQVQIIAQQITAEQAQFIIADDGCGFEMEPASHAPSSANDDTPHFGLNIMRERAIELDGYLEIRSEPGQGTQVLVTIKTLDEAEDVATATPRHSTAPQRVLLVDDHPLFLEGLANLLKVYGIEVVGVANNGLEAQTVARQTRPDLILMDIEMPVCDGIEATRRITAEFPGQRIIMLTVSASDDTLFAALKAGASGYLLKNMHAEELFMLIAGLEEGIPPIAPELAGKVLAEFQRSAQPVAELSDRQWQILHQIADGGSYREIAEQLHFSERTIKREMRQIMDALHLNSRADAEAYARQQFHVEA